MREKRKGVVEAEAELEEAPKKKKNKKQANEQSMNDAVAEVAPTREKKHKERFVEEADDPPSAGRKRKGIVEAEAEPIPAKRRKKGSIESEDGLAHLGNRDAAEARDGPAGVKRRDKNLVEPQEETTTKKRKTGDFADAVVEVPKKRKKKNYEA